MGGDNCAITNCTASRTINRGLNAEKDAWTRREKLLNFIWTQWTGGFLEQRKKPDAKIFICSHHFKQECFKIGKFDQYIFQSYSCS